jgi:vacuolar-type H+-ATPase subunit H
MVDAEEMMELLDQLRFNLPDEIKQANWTIHEQNRLIAEAHSESARILTRANEAAEKAMSNQELVRRAEHLAAQRVREAEGRADEIVREAEVYARDQLQQLEAHLSRTLATVKRGVEALHAGRDQHRELERALEEVET